MPAIGKDLSKIRSHLGLSIQDIQHETKIPVSTLRSIENGSIFDHPEENQTYIRSFVRSYGRALKIDDEVMINALDQHEIGNYNNLLLENYPELDPEISAGPQPEDDKKSEQDPDKKESDDEPEEKLIDIQGFEKDHDEEKTEIKQIEISDEPVDDSPQKESTTNKETPSTHSTKPKINDTEKSVKSVDWADVGRKFNQQKKHTPIWIIGLIIILLIAAFVSYFLYQNGFLSFDRLMQNDQQEQVSSGSEMSQRNLSLDLSDSLSSSETGPTPQPETTNEQEPSTELDDVLELTVYAAYDALGPVRVWSDLKPRMDPYWLEQGTAMNFEFEDTIRVRGSYSNLLLLKDGHLVENAAQEFFSEEEDYIELTRDFFSSDQKWSTSIEYQLPEGVSPPDSIAIRPTF